MTEGGGGAPGAGSGSVSHRAVVFSALLPGLAQILEGRRASGGFVLWVWVGFLSILVLQWNVVLAAPRGPLDDQVAFVTLFAGLLGALAWSFRDLRRAPRSPQAEVTGTWRVAAESFGRSRLAVLGLVIVGTAYLVALLVPFIAPYEPGITAGFGSEGMLRPSLAHPFGTDRLARDVLSMVLYGARISLSIGLLAVAISVTIGTVLGAVSGYLGGWADSVIMRVVDVVIAFPRLVLLIAVVALFDSSLLLIILVLGLTQWPSTTRIVRGEVLSLRERDFVQAARALGYSRARIIFRHVVPNVLGPVIVATTLGIGDMIVLEAGLSYLGLGVQGDVPSWGAMVADGQSNMLNAWWLSTFAGLAIVFTVLSFNLVGDGLRDALDPHLE
jgi:peptide/nickel transport system permease protein